jgi:hypothetical protein
MQSIIDTLNNLNETEQKQQEVMMDFTNWILALDVDKITESNPEVVEWATKLNYFAVNQSFLGAVYEREYTICKHDMCKKLYNNASEMVKSVWKADKDKVPVEFGATDREINKTCIRKGMRIGSFLDTEFNNYTESYNAMVVSAMNEQCSEYLLNDLRRYKADIAECEKRIGELNKFVVKIETFQLAQAKIVGPNK